MYNQYDLVRSRATKVTSSLLEYKEEVEIMSTALRVKIAAAEQAASDFYYVRVVTFHYIS